jgi:hypothetical protein
LNLCIFSLLLLLLRSGADPNIPAEPTQAPPPGHFLFYDSDQKFPLTLLLRLHVFHHDIPPMSSRIEINKYCELLETLCLCMRPAILQHVFYQYCHKGFYGTFCEAQCPVSRLLYENSTQTRTLSHMCRMTIWQACKERLNTRAQELPLPKDLIDFILWKPG